MSVIRRPNRSNHFEITSASMFVDPSQGTILKSEATKRFLEEYWSLRDHQRQSREERFNRLIQHLDNSSLNDEEKESIIAEFSEEENNFTRFSRTKLKPDNYDFISLIGRGGYADVWLVTDKKTKQPYALKIIQKSSVILSDKVTAVRNERDILTDVQNPWIVNLACSFQDSEHLYLVLEFIQGGDLMNLLIKCKVFPFPVVRFFCGEIALALHSVHEMGFVHRDLKPDNILLKNDGHIKLTDFGVASSYCKNDADYENLLSSAQSLMVETSKDQMFNTSSFRKHRRRNSIIGTIDYTAPEVLKGEQPTIASDWWAFGIILYEMLFGFTPFASDNPNETAFRIINWKKALLIPAGFRVPPQSLDLMKHLLCDKEERYTFEQIIAHPFFKGFNFEDPFSQSTPIKPQCTDPLDASHFDTFSDVDGSNLRAAGTLSKLANFAFLGFTYKAKPPSNALAKLGVSGI